MEVILKESIRVNDDYNDEDNHKMAFTISDALAQVKRISGKDVKKLAGDRGYRGQKIVGNTEILIPGVPQKKTRGIRKRRNTICSARDLELSQR